MRTEGTVAAALEPPGDESKLVFGVEMTEGGEGGLFGELPPLGDRTPMPRAVLTSGAANAYAAAATSIKRRYRSPRCSCRDSAVPKRNHLTNSARKDEPLDEIFRSPGRHIGRDKARTPHSTVSLLPDRLKMTVTSIGKLLYAHGRGGGIWISEALHFCVRMHG